MNLRLATKTVQVIRAESDRTYARWVEDQGDEQLGSYAWTDQDEPLINDMCLMLLVSVHHTLERELIRLFSRVTDSPEQEIPRAKWLEFVAYNRKCVKKTKGFPSLEWQTIREKLNSPREPFMETLQLLANCYKHEPTLEPNEALLKDLRLDLTHNYAPLPESHTVRDGLAAKLDLPDGADYCDIADDMINRASGFLDAVPTRGVHLGHITGGGSSRPSRWKR